MQTIHETRLPEKQGISAGNKFITVTHTQNANGSVTSYMVIEVAGEVIFEQVFHHPSIYQANAWVSLWFEDVDRTIEHYVSK